MMRNALVIAGACALSVLLSATADAQRERNSTGSRLGSNTVQSSNLTLNSSDEVHDIERLIANGRTEEAVDSAREYVASIRRQRPDLGSSVHTELYFALNSLCVALTSLGEYDEAISVCSEAIELWPSRWSAINNRGTANYASHRYADALEDYRRALAVAPDDEDIIATIEHNIILCEDQLTEA